MRLFIYEECEEIVEKLSQETGQTPTKYINTLLKVLRDECHNELTEEVNERIKNITQYRNGFNKS